MKTISGEWQVAMFGLCYGSGKDNHSRSPNINNDCCTPKFVKSLLLIGWRFVRLFTIIFLFGEYYQEVRQ